MSEWCSVLKLASSWEMKAIREVAIDTLTPMAMDPVTKIQLARENGIPGWILPALDDLASGGRGIGSQDVTRLGLDCALRVAELRGMMIGYNRAWPAAAQMMRAVAQEIFPDLQLPIEELYVDSYPTQSPGPHEGRSFGVTKGARKKR